MAFQPVPNTAQITVVQSLSGAEVVNTYHAEAPGGYDQTMIDTLAAQIDIIAAPGLLSDQSVRLSYVRTDVRGLNSINDLAATANANAGVGGTIDTSMPNNIAFSVMRLSGLTGRSARGRVYISGIPKTYVQTTAGATNLLTLSAANAYEAHVDAFRSTIEAIGPFDAVIVSRFSEGVKRPVGVTFPWLVTAYKDQQLDTMRRRMS